MPKKPQKKHPSKYGNLIRQAGSQIGGILGSRALGSLAGSLISKVTGQGDYRVAGGSATLNSTPQFGTLTEGFRVKHREYLFDVQGTNAFTTFTLPLNPGMSQTFPWLSTIAANFEKYKLHGLVFHLKSNSATAVSSTNTALGVWGCVTQYDVSNLAFTTKQECENYIGAQSSVPSQSILHGVECKPKVNSLAVLYVRTGGGISTQDLKFYDPGFFQYFSQGTQATSTIGELWVTYDIELIQPKLSNQGQLASGDLYGPFSSSGTAVLPNATILAPNAGSNLGSNILAELLYLPPSDEYRFYRINMIAYGLSSQTTLAAAPVVSGCTLVPAPTFGYQFTAGSNMTQAQWNFVIEVPPSSLSATVAFPTTTFTGTGSGILSVVLDNPSLYGFGEKRKLATEEFKLDLTVDDMRIMKKMLFTYKESQKKIPSSAKQDLKTNITGDSDRLKIQSSRNRNNPNAWFNDRASDQAFDEIE